ncbi:MAG: hypothetical protein AAGF53_09265 [Pseudomonadota bacterium]
MDADLIFAIGVVVGVFSIPAVISALSEKRAPRVAMFAIVVAGVMVVWAMSENPEGYSVKEIPEVIVRVVAKYLT